MQNIHITEAEGKPVFCFDTGIDPISFARTKMSMSLNESGFIVYPDGSHKTWKSSGVNEVNGFMRVWGPSFSGERLDLLLKDAISPEQDDKSQTAFNAVVFWIRAKLLLGDVVCSLNPGAAFVSLKDEPQFPAGCVFFTPQNLSQRCLMVEGAEQNYYCSPDLNESDAAAFCAGAMLYRILTGNHPYPDKVNVFQDMRDGVFIPLNQAAPGLDEKLRDLIHRALLLPVQKKEASANKSRRSGAEILGSLLKMLMDKEGNIISIPSLFRELTAEENAQLEKEKNKQKIKNISVKANRFITNNKLLLAGVAAALIFTIMFAVSLIKNRLDQPTTAGMDSNSVVTSYYDAFNSLDHVFMEICLMGADKSDINLTLNLYVIDKVRQSYELSTYSLYTSAEYWKQQGGEIPENVFGITDMRIEHITGDETDGPIRYRADYTLWIPNTPEPASRSDVLVLSRDRRKNWRITEIIR